MPRIPPQPAMPAQILTARVRRSGGWAAVMSDRVAGMMNAAPRPAAARPAINARVRPQQRDHGGDGKIASPRTRAPRRP